MGSTDDRTKAREEKARKAAADVAKRLRIFECRLCHKVFDSERAQASCPECDSEDVEDLSEG